MTRILWVNPLCTDAHDEALAQSFRDAVQPGTSVDVVSFGGEGPSHLEYSCYEALVAPDLLGTVRWAEESGYDALVIGCFYDPFLRAAREVATRMVVTAPAEACLAIASTLGEKFSVLVGRRKWVPEMTENVHKYGMADRLASFRVLGMGVNDFQVDHELTERRILEEATAAVAEDGADIVVLGCTIEFGFYRQVQEKVGVPVIDATVAPLKYAEFLADLSARFGWSHSKLIGYEGPTAVELQRLLRVVAPSRVVAMPR
ncbi:MULTISPECIES: aspartate/glutamate racemase family protein [Prauserella]|uniref:Hydantoin racemase n=2 Tax=Prauserella TaxID=142577 RepID=A0A318LEN4_9PSEU|nr:MULTISPECIES: aspartate/glutamate racemase family protein [Prauserella]PXY21482.1 hydantoin racemase [Prauserella flavalba]TKG60808.1 hydantoin racemase [Prauserella endophytica]